MPGVIVNNIKGLVIIGDMSQENKPIKKMREDSIIKE